MSETGKKGIRMDAFYSTRVKFAKIIAGQFGPGKAVIENRKLSENISLNDKTKRFFEEIERDLGGRREAMLEIAKLCIEILSDGNVFDVSRLRSTSYYDSRMIYVFKKYCGDKYGKIYLKVGIMDDDKLHVVIHPDFYRAQGYLE